MVFLRTWYNKLNLIRSKRERNKIYALNERYVHNYFKSKFQKKALLCYQPLSFLLPKGHWWFNKDSLHEQSALIAKALHERGYQVDIIDAMRTNIEFTENYDLVFDVLNNHENIVARQKRLGLKPPKVIAHYTTAYFKFHNQQDLNRFNEFNKRHGTQLSAARPLDEQSATYADAILAIGNEFTLSTFPEEVRKKTVLVPNTPLRYLLKYPLHKITQETKKRFLFLASSGAVFKGLDLIIDAFCKMPEFELYLAGSFVAETEFMQIYGPILEKQPHIKTVGWLDLEKKKFRDLYKKCSFHIFTSCSEGMPGAVISTMTVGLIPIVTKESGIDVETSLGKSGFQVEAKVSALIETVQRVAQMSPEELSGFSENASAQVRQYSKQFSDGLTKVLDKTL